ncbi:MAG: sigma-70 family RNA polymerase sigma factor [Planctomycetota bacterium]
MRSLDLRHSIVSTLADRYYDRVLCFARQLAEPDVAEDVTQEVFLRLSKLQGLEDRDISVSYLLKIAHNLVRARHRRLAQRVGARDQVRARAASVVESKLAGEHDVERDHRLRELMTRLSEHEQQAIHLTVCCGLSLREASEALGVRITTITNWKYRGLQKLAELSSAVAA